MRLPLAEPLADKTPPHFASRGILLLQNATENRSSVVLFRIVNRL